MTWLVQMLLLCITGTGFNPEVCAEYLNQIVEYQEQIEREECEKNNCYWYTIWIAWFPYDSDANKVANYRYDQSSWNIDMIATFMQEWMFNKDAISKTKDYWICQLHYNKTNAKRIDDERWSDIMFQAEVCVDKWLAVPNPSKVWYGWKVRWKYKQQIYYFE